MKRTDINDCPKDATHVKMNPSGAFIELFYRVIGNKISYLSTCSESWFYSESAEKDKDFINKLTPIE